MHRSVFFLMSTVSVASTSLALAQVQVQVQAQESAPPAVAGAALEAVDPLAEPRDLVEVAPNTVANLRKAAQLYESRIKIAGGTAQARADAYADLSRAYQRLGDLLVNSNEKISAYEKGRAAARKALAENPRHAEALFWDMANLATIGRTKGVMNSLFMIPDLRKGLALVLQIHPGHAYAEQTLGEIDHAVPGIVGGSDDRAEKSYQRILARDPHFTPTMVLLARLYKDQGKKDLAKKWAQRVLRETAPTLPNDWKKFDKPNAAAILRDLED